MKREDAMQGYWFVAVDDKRPSLAVDDAGLVGAPAWWRTVEMDGMADSGERRRVGWRGCFGTHGVRMGKREVERKGGTMYSGRACLKCEEIYKLSPHFKFLHWSVGDRTVISHTPNICRRRFRPTRVFFAPTVYESGREAISAEETLCFGADNPQV